MSAQDTADSPLAERKRQAQMAGFLIAEFADLRATLLTLFDVQLKLYVQNGGDAEELNAFMQRTMRSRQKEAQEFVMQRFDSAGFE